MSAPFCRLEWDGWPWVVQLRGTKASQHRGRAVWIESLQSQHKLENINDGLLILVDDWTSTLAKVKRNVKASRAYEKNHPVLQTGETQHAEQFKLQKVWVCWLTLCWTPDHNHGNGSVSTHSHLPSVARHVLLALPCLITHVKNTIRKMLRVFYVLSGREAAGWMQSGVFLTRGFSLLLPLCRKSSTHLLLVHWAPAHSRRLVWPNTARYDKTNQNSGGTSVVLIGHLKEFGYKFSIFSSGLVSPKYTILIFGLSNVTRMGKHPRICLANWKAR